MRDLRTRHVLEGGVASLLAVVGISIVFFTVLMALAVVGSSSKMIAGQLRYQGHAHNAAASGATDGLNWFQGQAVQPVATFTPRLDLAASPQVNETDDPAVGIVRTFQISPLGDVWGRYEVRTGNALDVSRQRGKAGTGTVWQYDSYGLVFVDRNQNGDLDFTDSDSDGLYDRGEAGEVVAARTIRSDIQHLALVLPAGNAVLQSARCSTVNLTSGGSSNRVYGSTAGIGVACKSGTGSPSLGSARVTGNPAVQANVNPYNDTVPDVFGVTQNELIGLANVKAPDAASLPSQLPAMSLIVVQGNATFTTGRPLVGSGILAVFGNLVVPGGSAFDGVIYVTGSYTQSGPSRVNGGVVVKGNLQLSAGGDITEAAWDAVIVQQVRTSLGGYRFARTPYVVP
jgi:hypothetical protein